MTNNMSGKLLAAIDALLQGDPNIRLETAVVFLHVCAGDGLSIKELVYLTGLGESMVSRAVEALRIPTNGALVRVEHHPADGRRRLVYLAEQGHKLKSQLEKIFLEAGSSPAFA